MILCLLVQFAMLRGGLSANAIGRPQASAPQARDRLDAPMELKLDGVSLSDALDAVRARAGVSILMDGWPAKRTADVMVRGTERDCIDGVSNAFDLSWSVGPGGVILMRKRLRSPDEAPQAHLLEYRATLSDINYLFDGFKFDPEESHWPMMLVALARGMSPPQAAALRSGQRLGFADLTPDQRGLLFAAISSDLLAHCGRIVRDLNSQVGALARSYLTEQTFAGRSHPTYVLRDSAGIAPDFYLGAITLSQRQ